MTKSTHIRILKGQEYRDNLAKKLKTLRNQGDEGRGGAEYLLKIEQRKRQLLQQLQQTFDDADRELLALESQKNELTQQLKQRLLSEIGTDDIKTRLSDKEEEFGNLSFVGKKIDHRNNPSPERKLSGKFLPLYLKEHLPDLYNLMQEKSGEWCLHRFEGKPGQTLAEIYLECSCNLEKRMELLQKAFTLMNNITDKDLKQVAEYVVALEEPFVAVTSINVAGGFDYDHFSGTKFEYKLEKTEDMTYHFSGTTEEQQLYDNGIKQAYILNEARRRYWSTVQKYVEGLYELYGKGPKYSNGYAQFGFGHRVELPESYKDQLGQYLERNHFYSTGGTGMKYLPGLVDNDGLVDFYAIDVEEIGMNKDTPEAKSLIQYEEIGNILDEYDRKFCKIEQKIDYIKEGRDKRERSLGKECEDLKRGEESLDHRLKRVTQKEKLDKNIQITFKEREDYTLGPCTAFITDIFIKDRFGNVIGKVESMRRTGMGHMRPHFHFTTVDASYIDYQRKKATITFSNHGKNPSIYDDILLDASSPIFSDFDGEKAKKADIILMYQKDDNYVKFMEHYKVNLLLAEKKRYEIIIQDKNRLTAENQKFIDTYKDKLITNGDNIQEVRKDDFFVQLFQYLEKHGQDTDILRRVITTDKEINLDGPFLSPLLHKLIEDNASEFFFPFFLKLPAKLNNYSIQDLGMLINKTVDMMSSDSAINSFINKMLSLELGSDIGKSFMHCILEKQPLNGDLQTIGIDEQILKKLHLRFEQRKREENDKQEKEKAQQIERMTHLLESGRISQGRQKIENSGKAQKYMLLKNKEDGYIFITGGLEKYPYHSHMVRGYGESTSLGGGWIKIDDDKRNIFCFGESSDYGSCREKIVVRAILYQKYPDYTIIGL